MNTDFSKANKDQQKKVAARPHEPWPIEVAPSSSDTIFDLQRMAGNRAVGQSLRSGGRPFIQRKPVNNASLPERALEKTTLPELIVEDETTTLNPRQMRKSEFLRFGADRARRGLDHGVKTGQIIGVPEELPGAVAGGNPALRKNSSIGDGFGKPNDQKSAASQEVHFKGREGGAKESGDPQAIKTQLGPGQSLNGDVKSRMESAFGANFSHVRLHNDADAARLSGGLNARAFTVGEHVAFGSGEYRPGTLVGDAIIAHELAHVMQQESATSSTRPLQNDSVGYNSLERDADTSALGAVASLFSGARGELANLAKNTKPRLMSGLRLQRCSSKVNELPEPAIGSMPDYDSISNPDGFIPEEKADQAMRMLVNSQQLEQVYSDKISGNKRAAKIFEQLEELHKKIGIKVAEQENELKCSIPPAEALTTVITGSDPCNTRWENLKKWLPDDKPGAMRLREVIAEAYEKRAKELHTRNQIIFASLNLILAGRTIKGALKGPSGVGGPKQSAPPLTPSEPVPPVKSVAPPEPGAPVKPAPSSEPTPPVKAADQTKPAPPSKVEPSQPEKPAAAEANKPAPAPMAPKASNLSLDEVKQDLLMIRNDVKNNLPNINTQKKAVLDELDNLSEKIKELEKKNGKVDISKELNEIAQRQDELYNQVANDLPESANRTPPAKATAKQGASPASDPGKQPPQLARGRDYNKLHAFDYKYKEIYIKDPKGGPSFQLDGYEPGKWIVSRKDQQLAKISLSEAKSHIKEFSDKYAKGRLIDSSVPSSGLQTGGAPATGGQKLTGTLQGDYVLEVPIQSKPVPPEILMEAKKAGVIIRDVAGKVY
jgi:hypothetical protein